MDCTLFLVLMNVGRGTYSQQGSQLGPKQIQYRKLQLQKERTPQQWAVTMHIKKREHLPVSIFLTKRITT